VIKIENLPSKHNIEFSSHQFRVIRDFYHDQS
jgi:hypothetical protein